MITFVLLPCHFLGSVYWERVVSRLRAVGHRAVTFDLAGWGSQAHALTPEVGLARHVQDVASSLENGDLTSVVLVGHSYSGMVLAGLAASAVSRRLHHLVFFDAAVPRHGETLFDQMPDWVAAWYREQASTLGDGWRVPPPGLGFYGLSEADRAWLAPHVGPVSLRTCEEPLDAPRNPAWGLPRTFVWCREYPVFAETAARTREASGWRYSELATGHLPMVTHPELVTALLLELPIKAAV